jgi:hypothetical protein
MMRGRETILSAFAAAGVALALAFPVDAQAKGKDKSHQSSPPSSSSLPSLGGAGPTASGASLLAWIDDATVLTPGTMALTISAMRWSGTDLGETDVPIVNMSIGVAPRVQLGASIPRIVGSTDGTGPVGGIGTSYLSAKVAILEGRSSGVKLAVTPTIEILGEGAAQALTLGEGRTRFGLPVSAEIVRGSARLFASTGFFSRGVWFAGGGAGVQVSPRIAMTLSASRAWANDTLTGVSRNRGEISGGASCLVRPQIAVFGSLGRTIATLDADGAGTTLSGGVTFLLTPVVR